MWWKCAWPEMPRRCQLWSLRRVDGPRRLIRKEQGSAASNALGGVCRIAGNEYRHIVIGGTCDLQGSAYGAPLAAV